MSKGALLLKERGAKNIEHYTQLVDSVGELALGTGSTQL
jgi:hypothetical protein